MAPKVEVTGIREADLADLSRFQSRQGSTRPPPERGDPLAHLRWYLFDNPAALSDVPPGWIARDATGEVVGAKYCVPQRFRCDTQVFTLLLGGGYYVDSGHRGVGLLLMRKYLSLSDRYSHFATTMNEVSGAIYERFGGYPIEGSDRELLGVLRWPPIVEEVLARRLGGSTASRLLAPLAALRPAAIRGRPEGALSRATSVDDVKDIAERIPTECAGLLTAVREPEFLRWRYFAGSDATRELLRYEGPRGSCMVAVQRRARGRRSQARTLFVLDLWGDLPPGDTADVARALANRYRADVDALVFRGLLEPRVRALRSAGFVERKLPRATGVCIDKSGRLPTRSWYLVPADGDTGH